MNATVLVHPFLALVLAPLLPGLVSRTKAFFAGRRGAPLLQPYRDLFRLLGKGAVYSPTTTWVFRAAPIVGLAGAITALFVLPLGSLPALLAFDGDFVLLAALLAAGRFLAIAAALDTGSSFGGLGASREALVASLAEPALFLALASVAHAVGHVSLSTMLPAITAVEWMRDGPTFLLAAAALLAVLLAECSRIPIDDPTTHLELTMIHEALILDHSGPDLALILYGATLKLWVLGALLVEVVVPLGGMPLPLQAAALAGGMLLLALVIGTVESSMARLRLHRVPQLLVGATAFAVLALLLVLQ